MLRYTLILSILLFGAALFAQEWSRWGGSTGRFQLDAVQLHAWPQSGLQTLWSRELGDGNSPVVCNGASLYTMYRSFDGKVIADDEVIIALESGSGKTLWEYSYSAPLLPGQGFQGEKGPHASPLLYNGHLYTLGFGSDLVCLDAASGKKKWNHNLIREFAADTLQFGNSSSPIVYKDRIIVMAFGRDAGTMAFDAASGKPVWKSEDMVFSYASPVIANLHGEDMVVVMGGHYLWGLSVADGSTLWRHPLRNPGQTNAPDPYLLPDNQLFIAGQGAGGAALIKITKSGESYSTGEVWHNRKINLFMGTQVVMGDFIAGGDRRLMFAFDWRSGDILWRKRGFANPKLLAAGNRALILSDNGELVLADLSRSGLTELASTTLLEERSWTAPTVIGKTMYARDRRVIKALALPQAGTVLTSAPAGDDKGTIEDLLLNGKVDAAMSRLKKLDGINPADITEEWLLGLGSMLVGQELGDAAVALFSEARRRYPDSGKLAFGLREGYRVSGNQPMVATLDEEIMLPISFTVKVPDGTRQEDKVYIVGSGEWLGNWDPAAVAMTPRGDGYYSLQLHIPRGMEIQYKFTRGSWESVERDAQNQDTQNRQLTISGETRQVEQTVEKWADRQ